MHLSELAEDGANPRIIKAEAAKGLQYSLAEFGDLSGIVWNEKLKKLVGGHQRRRQIISKFGDLEIKRKPGEEFGTAVAKTGEVFHVRFVQWDEVKHRAANVAANNQKIAGEFTDNLADYLAPVQDENPELLSNLLMQDFISQELDAAVMIDEEKYDKIVLEEVPVGKLPDLTWVVIAINTDEFGNYVKPLRMIEELKPQMYDTTVSFYRKDEAALPKVIHAIPGEIEEPSASESSG
jgi:hypothetical protein